MAAYTSSALQKAVKRLFDVVASLLLLLIVSPVVAVLAFLVWREDRGSPFFRHARLGQHGTTFLMWKLRTMKVNAADIRNPDGSTFNADNDPRVTRIGAWLRRTSLDELPQLWNVLKGDMSLVGPRPDLPDSPSHYRPKDHARMQVRPGITGWAQVVARNDLPWEQRRDLDLEYIARANLVFDFYVLWRTPMRVLGQEGVVGKPGAKG